MNAQKEILLQIELQLEQEEIYWVQRACANWLKQRNRNTNFFHCFASSHKKRNLVKGLVDNQGEVLDVEDGVLNDVDRRVTNEMI